MTERMKMVGDEVAAILCDALFNYGAEILSRTMMTSAVCEARRWSPGKEEKEAVKPLRFRRRRLQSHSRRRTNCATEQ